jgi:subtilisin family serine protease
VVDTGLVQDAPARHPWLNGVTGPADPQVDEGVSIAGYGGHGTFIASIVRAMAPRAEVRIARDFDQAGALYESGIVRTLLNVLNWAPDVISLSAGTHTWKHGGLMSFHVFVNGPLRECPGTVLVAAAGNDGADWKFSPAEMDSVVGVGALGPPGDARAWFSDYGDWVKVFAPGVDLVHAFARGAYEYREIRAGQAAQFEGMARWSGTSFSTPVVAGLVAARMSGTGESSHEAAESLLRLARAQALPDVGPVLLASSPAGTARRTDDAAVTPGDTASRRDTRLIFTRRGPPGAISDRASGAARSGRDGRTSRNSPPPHGGLAAIRPARG